MPRVKFEVTTDAAPYWIAVGKKDVPLTNGKGYVNLDPGQHRLIWWFQGDHGIAMKIVGKVDDNEVVSLTSTIPDDSYDGAGRKKFNV
jgi:hypothetical protein